eukprot:350481-Chlamydomonas_euryale.AAC.5
MPSAIRVWRPVACRKRPGLRLRHARSTAPDTRAWARARSLTPRPAPPARPCHLVAAAAERREAQECRRWR